MVAFSVRSCPIFQPVAFADVLLFAEKSLASKFRQGFPGSLDSSPFLLPADGTTLRHLYVFKQSGQIVLKSMPQFV